MFWKNKKSERPYLRLKTEDRRSAVRVNPCNQLSMEVEGRVVPVMDISAGGIAFSMDGTVPNDQVSASLNLAMFNRTVDVTIKVVSVENKDICHGYFLSLTAEEQEILHCYILEIQKQAIRSHKHHEV